MSSSPAVLKCLYPAQDEFAAMMINTFVSSDKHVHFAPFSFHLIGPIIACACLQCNIVLDRGE